MKLSKQEQIAEKIALLLLKLDQDDTPHDPDRNTPHDPDRNEMVAYDAVQMAYRANMAKTDATWWAIPGKPWWNERMARLRKLIKK